MLHSPVKKNNLFTSVALAMAMGGMQHSAFPSYLSPSTSSPRRIGQRPCRECGKPKVRLWKEKGIDLCWKCYQKDLDSSAN